MNNKKSYIEIMNDLEMILPSPSNFDYSNANKKEIIKSIISFLKSISPHELITALDEFNRNDNNITNWNSKTFDGVGRLTSIIQLASYYLDNIKSKKRYNDDNEEVSIPKEHQYIYSQIRNIKEMIYDYILNYLNYNKYMIGNENSYNEQFGSIKEIEEYIEEANIEDYIKTAFNMKKDDYESYDLITYLFSIKEVLIHFGISEQVIDINKIEQDLKKAMIKKDIDKEIDILRIEKYIVQKVEEITKKAYYKRIKKDNKYEDIQRRITQEKIDEMLQTNDIHPIGISFSSKK